MDGLDTIGSSAHERGGVGLISTSQTRDALLSSAVKRLSPKRKSKGPGIDGWYPYYAGFSFDFVAAAIPGLVRGSNDIIMDPWNGSGTTTAAAAYCGYSAIGLDLNPATVTIARSKIVTKSELSKLLPLLRSCMQVAQRAAIGTGKLDPLLRWLPPRPAGFARSVIEWLCRQDAVRTAAELSPLSSTAAICLLCAVRDFAVDQSKSNQTWTSPQPGLRRLAVRQLSRRTLEHATRLLDNSDQCCDVRPSGTEVCVGDSRHLSLPSESIDVIVGSPPYCTRVDYARQTGLELALLTPFDEGENRNLRHELMGTTTIRRARPIGEGLPVGVAQLLRNIDEHPSHRSRSYYGRNFRQYFDDASTSMAELARIIRTGGRAMLVLQNSYYKEIEIKLSEHYCELATMLGLSAEVIARNKVQRTMTMINTRSKQYRRGREYTEDVVLLEK